VRLLAPATVADDGIAFTNRAPPQQGPLAVARPIGFELVQRRESGIKRIVFPGRSTPVLTCQDLSRKQSPPPEEKNPKWKKITPLTDPETRGVIQGGLAGQSNESPLPV
jgi:hypothetical protein